jgi:hypothetical protein
MTLFLILYERPKTWLIQVSAFLVVENLSKFNTYFLELRVLIQQSLKASLLLDNIKCK